MSRYVISEERLAEAVAAIAHYPEDVISYDTIDRLLGLDVANLGELELQQMRIRGKDRINTRLEAGVPVDGRIVAFILRVGSAGDHFIRYALVDSISMSIDRLYDDMARIMDRVTRDQAYALGEDEYPSLLTGTKRTFRKESPPISQSDADFLRPTYSGLIGQFNVMKAILEGVRGQHRALMFARTRATPVALLENDADKEDDKAA